MKANATPELDVAWWVKNRASTLKASDCAAFEKALGDYKNHQNAKEKNADFLAAINHLKAKLLPTIDPLKAKCKIIHKDTAAGLDKYKKLITVEIASITKEQAEYLIKVKEVAKKGAESLKECQGYVAKMTALGSSAKEMATKAKNHASATAMLNASGDFETVGKECDQAGKCSAAADKAAQEAAKLAVPASPVTVRLAVQKQVHADDRGDAREAFEKATKLALTFPALLKEIQDAAAAARQSFADAQSEAVAARNALHLEANRDKMIADYLPIFTKAFGSLTQWSMSLTALSDQVDQGLGNFAGPFGVHRLDVYQKQLTSLVNDRQNLKNSWFSLTKTVPMLKHKELTALLAKVIKLDDSMRGSANGLEKKVGDKLAKLDLFKNPPDWVKTLGLSWPCTLQDVRKAKIAFNKKYHPSQLGREKNQKEEDLLQELNMAADDAERFLKA